MECPVTGSPKLPTGPPLDYKSLRPGGQNKKGYHFSEIILVLKLITLLPFCSSFHYEALAADKH